jgi:hypothetical protein
MPPASGVEIQRRADGREGLRLAASLSSSSASASQVAGLAGLVAHRPPAARCGRRRCCRRLARSPPAGRAGRPTGGWSARRWAICARAWSKCSASALASASEALGHRALGLPRRPGGHHGDADGGRRPARSATARARSPAGLQPHDRLDGGSAARQPAGAQQREDGVAGTNHVQSTNECTPKTTQMDSSVAMPTRSGVHGAPRPGPRARPCAWPRPATRRAARARRPCRQRRGRPASARRSRGRGARRGCRCDSAGGPSRSRRRPPRAPCALGDLQRLVPVAGAHAADRVRRSGEFVMLPLACGSVRFVQPLESEPPGRARTGRAPRRGRPARARARRARARRPAGAPRATGARWALAKPMPRPATSRTTSMATRAMPSSWPAAVRSARADVVGAQRVRGEGPEGHEPAAEGARGQHRHARAGAAARPRTTARSPTASASSAPRE